jgi:hypothetical protein
MEGDRMATQRFTVTTRALPGGGVLIPVPFDPDEVWSVKPRHHVGGTVNGAKFRAIIEVFDGVRGVKLGSLWREDCRVGPDESVEVVIEPEGPQRSDLAEDIADALAASPTAAAFFDGLAQFYRRGYLRWIDATKRSPQRRAERIARMVELLEAGVKDYRSG